MEKTPFVRTNTDFVAIQSKWQKIWFDAKINESEPSNKPKFFLIFAYPGISGYLHVGHMRGYSYSDIITRVKRMQGYNVLFPVGTHATGNQAIAFANKLVKKDKDWINYLKKNGCTDEQLSRMKDARKVVDYFNEVYVEDYWKKFGFLADYRRFTCTIFEDYAKFIQWQFKKLNDKGLLVQKPYFATACLNCGPVAVDPSETDLLRGGNAEKNEYTLLKFKYKDAFIVAATLRPETVFGQTNLWLDPDIIYVKAKVGKENWIASKECIEKIKYQVDGEVSVVEEVFGKELIGKYVVAPGIEREIIILPSKFCDPNVGTGIVTSVPSDAPHDYIGLKDLQDSKEMCAKYGLDYEKIKLIKLIPIIKTPGFGDFPAKELCEKLNIANQFDSAKLEEAKKEVYKEGFFKGVMRNNCGVYSGMPVQEAKEKIKQFMINNGQAGIMYDLSEEVICRCGGKVFIKKIPDQWFIKYSDSELTERSKAHAKTMMITPEDYYNSMPNVLDWFQDRACTRLGNWLGTKLPFDEKWTIEPISDSTLYPVYYIVSKYVNDNKINSNQLTEEFFDFVYLGKGSVKDVATKTGADEKIIRKIREDFLYYYPLDINLGGKEHQTVHFPVFLMNHVGILNKEHWPKGIFVNYWVVGDGSKISKSKGGAEPIPGAIEKYSVDAMRLYYCNVGSSSSDIIWSEEKVLNYRKVIEEIFDLVLNIRPADVKEKSIDFWIKSKINSRIKKASFAVDNYDLRAFSETAVFGVLPEVKKYLARNTNAKTIEYVIDRWLKLLSPVIPHVTEELWQKTGHNSLLSLEQWPSFDESLIDENLERIEEVIENLRLDIFKVKDLAKLAKVSKVKIFVSPEWKWSALEIVKKACGNKPDFGAAMKALMANPEMKKHGAEIQPFLKTAINRLNEISEMEKFDEIAVLNEAKPMLEKEFGLIEVISAEKSSEAKAKNAFPGKPALLIE